jgi:hypothetical protein
METTVKEKIEVFWFSEQPYGYVTDEYGNEEPMPHQDVMRSIELFGREVIPALHEITLQPYA